MKNLFILFVSILILSSSTCKKEGNDCHYSISINNLSSDSIIYAFPATSKSSNCSLIGELLKPGENTNYFPDNNSCTESQLSNGESRIIIYLIDPNKFNKPNEFYACDSVGFNNNNKVLKLYVLSLNELKQNNFKLNYS